MRNKLLIVAVLLTASGSSSAQLVTLDPTNLVQNITQVQKALQTVQSMQKQLQATEQAYKATTGARGMGLLKTDLTKDYVPKNWQETLAMAQTGSDYAKRVKSIRDLAGAIGATKIKGLSAETNKFAEQSSNREINSQAIAAESFDRANQRFATIGALGAKIESATDQKSILDLSARIQVENANLQNELIRILAESNAAQAGRNIDQQRTNNAHRAAISNF
ncbi:hypothetical protein J7369_14255 [Xanthomonas phaseoli pv. dieffenbachiae]|uniref:type IV secretion system protein n=1 Tax=Xanthomonas phaseoli TaxID=1985254 RepID=UPI001ADA2B81|nr:type IV secretion system protein [Xanthomonas phaseoli]MBO9898849.1 hypothetical protein [Xanthomonas phaseoli pv. dieffenbachiae]